MVNTWIHPVYDTTAQLVPSNSSRTMTRQSGLPTSENLPFDSNVTLANGASPTVLSVTFDVRGGAGDGLIFGLRDSSQTVAVGYYPGDGTHSVGVQSDGQKVYGNVASSLISGGFAAGDQADMEVDRSASPPTVRWRKVHAGTPGSWTASTDISFLGSGVLTVWATTYYATDQITWVNGSTPPAGVSGSSITMLV